MHYGEDLYTYGISAFYNDEEPGRKELLQQLVENKNRLILLDPHPDAKGMDHDVESPTFMETFKYRIKDYLEQK